MKRLMCALLACSSILGGIISAAQAVEAPNETVVRLEDLTWERIDLSTVEHCAAGPWPLGKLINPSREKRLSMLPI